MTAGNSSEVNDGACAVSVKRSGDAAARFGLVPMARVAGTAVAGVEPDLMGIGPIFAIRQLLTRAWINRWRTSASWNSMKRLPRRRWP